MASLRALVFLACLLFCGPARAAAPIVIGHLLPMTGLSAPFGIAADRGLTLAELERNAAGGVAGHPVHRVTVDTQGRLEEVAPAMERLKSERVAAIIGEISSSRTLAAAPFAQAAGIPLLTPTATNPALTQAGDHVFRACFLDPLQATAMARFAVDEKLLRVAMLVDQANDYSISLADTFAREFPERGGRVVATERYREGDFDYTSQLRSIVEQTPDALYVPGYYTEAGLIARQARELGFRGTLLGGDGWDSEKLVEIGGEAIEGAVYTNHWAIDVPGSDAFRQRFSNQYGEPPDVIAALAYDAANLLFAAMDRVAHEQPRLLHKARLAEARDALTRALAATRDFPGVTGMTSFGPAREVIKPVYVVRARRGGPTWVTTVEPTR